MEITCGIIDVIAAHFKPHAHKRSVAFSAQVIALRNKHFLVTSDRYFDASKKNDIPNVLHAQGISLALPLTSGH